MSFNCFLDLRNGIAPSHSHNRRLMRFFLIVYFLVDYLRIFGIPILGGRRNSCMYRVGYGFFGSCVKKPLVFAKPCSQEAYYYFPY